MKQVKSKRSMTASVKVVKTPFGKRKVAISGAGIPILIIHGSPGWVDAAQLMEIFYQQINFALLRYLDRAT